MQTLNTAKRGSSSSTAQELAVPPAEQISALVDGELTPSQLSQALASAYYEDGRAQWASYQLIGDALRSDELVHGHLSERSENFLARMQSALEHEPHYLPPATLRKPSAPVVWARKAIPSMAVAAAVAAVSWVVVPQLRNSENGTTVALSTPTNSKAVNSSEGLIMVSSQTAQGASVNTLVAANGAPITMIRDAGLDAYLEAHGQYAPRAAAPHIRVVSAGQEDCGTSC